MFAITHLAFAGSVSAESCREQLFSDAVQTHSSTGSTNLGYNSFLSNNPDSVLQTPALQSNGGSNVSSCGTSNCVASGTGATSLALETFQLGQSGQDFQSGYQGSLTLGNDGVREFDSVVVGSEGDLSFAGGATDPVYLVDSLTLGYQGELNLAPGTYWIQNLSLNTRSRIRVVGEGTARLYVQNALSIPYEAEINTDGNQSANDLVLVAYSNVTFNSQVNFTGRLYSAGNVSIGSGTAVSGAVVGSSVSTGSNASIAYIAPDPTADFGQVCAEDVSGGGSGDGDLDGDGIPDGQDDDRDGDGEANDTDAFPDDPNETADFDLDGVGDNADLDQDNDGVPNASDICSSTVVGSSVDQSGCSEAQGSQATCRGEVFGNGLQTHGANTGISFGYNAYIGSSSQSILNTQSVTTNGGSSELSCGSQHCEASNAPLAALSLLAFENSTSSDSVSVPYQGFVTLGDDGTRDFGVISTSSGSTLAFVGDTADEAIYRIKTLNVGYKSTVALQSGTYWIENLTMAAEASLIVAAGQTARVYVGNDLFVGYRAAFNPAQTGGQAASELALIVYGSLSTNSETDLSGLFYADGSIVLGFATEASGSFTGAGITLNTNVSVSFSAPSPTADLGQICAEDINGGGGTAGDPNAEPQIVSTAVVTADEGQPYEYAVAAIDPDQDTLTYSLTVAPVGMAVDGDGLITWLPGAPGFVDVTLVVDDANGGVVSQSFQIDVSPAVVPNNDPEIGSTPVTTATEGVPYQYAVTATDADQDVLTYSLTVAPTGMAVDASGLICGWRC